MSHLDRATPIEDEVAPRPQQTMDDGQEDPRLEELVSLEAIFPEIQRPAEDDPYTFVLELPVKPTSPVTVTYPAAASSSDLSAAVAAATSSQLRHVPCANGLVGQQNLANGVSSHRLSYLPPVSLRMSLPSGYPQHKPPVVRLHTTPQWIPTAVIRSFEDDAHRLWEEMGHDMVAYTYIDHIQQLAEGVFGMVNTSETLEVDLSHMVAILDHDIKATRAAFESETFDCGVCLGTGTLIKFNLVPYPVLTDITDPKKGIVCHRMTDCGHVFCVLCLQDFYAEALRQGDVNVVRCLSPGCAKAREAQAAEPKKGRKATASISPGELLAIGLSQDVVSRYVSLKYKKELESDKTTVYCPRKWCDGAAVSKRHKKPRGLELQEPEGDDAEDDEAPDRTDRLLAVCEDCAYAFCTRCRQSWHGEFVRCRPKIEAEELAEEERASLEYIHRWTRPCASCDAPAQKTEGCNHMICFRCNTHFCYLCSAWLDPQNPYSHFNRLGANGCYQRLWDLQGGHGENVDWVEGFERRAAMRERPHEEPFGVIIEQPAVEELGERAGGGNARGEDGGGVDGEARPENIQVEREGPLVLRIEQQARPRREAPARPAPAAPAGRGGRQQNGPQRGRGGGLAGGGGHRQQQQHPPGPAHHNAAWPRARGDIGQNRGGQRPAMRGPDAPRAPAREAELNEQQRAWVRRFVQLALVDEEDSGSEDEGLGIF